MLRTRFADLFDLQVPIMSAPMALHSGGTLAGAVSAAGGLGSFGGVHPAKGPDWIRAEIDSIRAVTDRPFAVGFITPFLAFTEPLFEATLAQAPAVVALSFGEPETWIGRIHDAGAVAMCQVQTFAGAEAAVAAGADVIVAQGNEAGGHTGTMGMLPFLAALCSTYPELPILAAGGIADGRTLAAALVAGADGVWMGTAFLATPEAVEVHDEHKRLLVSSDGGDTVFTRAYDIVSGLPWPSDIGERVRRNRFTDQWAGREAELQARRADFAADPDDVPFNAPPDPEQDSVLYGQSAGLVNEIRSAAEVLRQTSEEAEAILRDRPASLFGRSDPSEPPVG